MDAADFAAYQKKEMTVPQLMERYYPTKLMPKVSEESFKMPKSIAGPEGNISVEKFNVYTSSVPIMASISSMRKSVTPRCRQSLPVKT